MATATLKRNKRTSLAGISRERIFVDMPQSDMAFFQLFADKMGWLVESKTAFLDKYIASCPKNVPLTDEDIMEEVRAVRYAKV